MKRWHTEVTHLDGSRWSFDVEEPEELQSMIECGRDFHEIDRITIRYRLAEVKQAV